MKSCTNCFCFGEITRICHYTEDEKDCIENDYKYWRPNYMLMVKENTELKQELEVYKKALKMMAKAKLFDRMETPYEDDIKAEMEWFLGTARRALSR